MTTHEYAFDARLVAAFRVRATSPEEAKRKLVEALNCASANLGAIDGDPLLAEVSIDLGDDGPDLTLYEIDGTPV